MKPVLFLLILFCTIALPVFGQLTETDLNKIRLIVQEEIKREFSTINKKVDTLDSRIQNVEKDVAWMQGKPESVNKQIPHAKYVYYGLIALIVIVVAALLTPVVQEIRKDRLLKKQIEKLTQEVETLKQQRIVNP